MRDLAPKFLRLTPKAALAIGSILVLISCAGMGLRQATSLPAGALMSSAPMPGTQTGSLAHGGLARTYLLHVPENYRHGHAAPLVIALHGGGGQGRGMERLTGLSEVSDAEGFIVAYPDGLGRTWNDGRGLERFQAMRENVDDVGFIGALIDAVSREYSIDRRRVYVTGISNGGHMAHRLGVELSERIAAIAPVAASMPASIASAPPPQHPVSVIQFFGTEDRNNYWAGGGRAGGASLSVPDVMSWWARANNCATPATVEELPNVEDDGTSVRRESYGRCVNGAEVVLYAIAGGGHNGPGWNQYLPVDQIGRTSRDIDANRTMWEFFARHSRAPQ